MGTSGWKFDDWAGTFYPHRVPRSRWLEYYAARFTIGEINSTYYRIAPPSVYAAIARKTPNEFQLFAKVHSDVTHVRKDPADSVRNLLYSLQSLRECGRLLGLLAQFPASFRFNNDNLRYVLELPTACEDIRLCVEFRHRSWQCEDAFAPIRASGVVWVSPDEPDLPDLLPFRIMATADIAYVRLHGRNSAAWYDRSAGDRYDYDYSEQELIAIGKELLHFAGSPKKVFVLFNNCHLGRAPRNAGWLKTWLEQDAARN